MPAMPIDSDVLVWPTRGHPGAGARLRAIRPWRISTVTYTELSQGCRDKAELARLKKGLTARRAEIVPITPAISSSAPLPPGIKRRCSRPSSSTSRQSTGSTSRSLNAEEPAQPTRRRHTHDLTPAGPCIVQTKVLVQAVKRNLTCRYRRNKLKQVFGVLRELMTPPDPPKRPIGFIDPEGRNSSKKTSAASKREEK